MTKDTENLGRAVEPVRREPFDFARWWDRVGILVVLVALVVFMAVFAPNFARVDNLLNERYETAWGYGSYGRSAFVGIRARL